MRKIKQTNKLHKHKILLPSNFPAYLTLENSSNIKLINCFLFLLLLQKTFPVYQNFGFVAFYHVCLRDLSADLINSALYVSVTKPARSHFAKSQNLFQRVLKCWRETRKCLKVYINIMFLLPGLCALYNRLRDHALVLPWHSLLVSHLLKLETKGLVQAGTLVSF
jgi:hypothetical protein